MDPDETGPTDEELAAIEAEQAAEAGYCPHSEPTYPPLEYPETCGIIEDV